MHSQPHPQGPEPFTITRNRAAMRLGMSYSTFVRRVEPKLDSHRDARGRVLFRESDVEDARAERLATGSDTLLRALADGVDPVELVTEYGATPDEAAEAVDQFARLRGCIAVPRAVVEDLRVVLQMRDDEELHGTDIAAAARRYFAEVCRRFELEVERRANIRAQELANVEIARIKASVEREKIQARGTTTKKGGR